MGEFVWLDVRGLDTLGSDMGNGGGTVAGDGGGGGRIGVG